MSYKKVPSIKSQHLKSIKKGFIGGQAIPQQHKDGMDALFKKLDLI